MLTMWLLWFLGGLAGAAMFVVWEFRTVGAVSIGFFLGMLVLAAITGPVLVAYALMACLAERIGMMTVRCCCWMSRPIFTRKG